jgi:tetratricopeptide (TPR) repeat protein
MRKNGSSTVCKVSAPALAALAVLALSVGAAAAQQQPGGPRDGFTDQDARRAPRDFRPTERQDRNPPSSKDGKSADAPPPKPIPQRLRPPSGSSVPYAGAEKAKLLDELYARLATAESETVASRITAAIEHVWQSAASDTIRLLMERARRAATEKKTATALRLMDRAAQLAPDNPEVFHQRAALHFAQNDLRSTVGDLRRVLALEPNHYKALETLGQIFKEMDQKKAALEFYRKLHLIHPNMAGVKSTLDELERDVMGQDS